MIKKFLVYTVPLICLGMFGLLTYQVYINIPEETQKPIYKPKQPVKIVNNPHLKVKIEKEKKEGWISWSWRLIK